MLESKTSKKLKSLKNQIRSAQNVGKVWMSRKNRGYLEFGDLKDKNLKMKILSAQNVGKVWINRK